MAILKYIQNISSCIVMESNNNEFGLFTTKDIKQHTLLCEISGKVISKQFLKEYKKLNFHNEKTEVGIGLVFTVKNRSSYSFIGDSFEKCNVYEVFDSRKEILKVFAKRDIEAREQLFGFYPNSFTLKN